MYHTYFRMCCKYISWNWNILKFDAAIFGMVIHTIHEVFFKDENI